MPSYDFGACGRRTWPRQRDDEAEAVEQMGARRTLGRIEGRHQPQATGAAQAQALALYADLARIQRAQQLVRGAFRQQVAVLDREHAAVRTGEQAGAHHACPARECGL